MTQDHIRRTLRGVQTQLISNRNVSGGARFACDLNGETDPHSKSCQKSREESVRVLKAPYLVTMAIAAREDSEALCDAVALVSDVLPLFLDGHVDLSSPESSDFCGLDGWALLNAKYYFYWYQDATHCGEAPPLQPVDSPTSPTLQPTFFPSVAVISDSPTFFLH